jgi:putative nucleotidyltransferase with HDIG domain
MRGVVCGRFRSYCRLVRDAHPLAYRWYSALLLVAAIGVTVAVSWGEPVDVDAALLVIVAAGLASCLPWAVQSSERSAISLNHLPILAAVLVCSPVVAPALAGTLAAIDNRAYGRWAVISNAGGVALSAASAVGVIQVGGALGAPTSAGEPAWFFLAAAAAAATFFLVNHAAASGMAALKYGEPLVVVWRRFLRPMIGPDIIGSSVVIGFVSLVNGVDGTALKVVAGAVAIVSVALLLGLIIRNRQVIEAVTAREQALQEREAAVAAREAAVADAARALRRADSAARAERVASARAARAVTRLNDVASGTVPVLVAMVDLRDRYTARHSAGVGRLCRLLATELGWSPEDVALAHMTGLVHDIGKVGLPDEILRKPGRPTVEEWRLIQRHADWGADALAEMRLMPAAVDGVRAHHERWDGSGYPRGLRGHEIPSLGRLVALCDSFDAMTGHRPFRGAKPHHVAMAELAQEAGQLYDPHMTEALLEVLDKMEDLDEVLAPRDFAAEWRQASAGIDMERLYLRISADLEAGAELTR